VIAATNSVSVSYDVSENVNSTVPAFAPPADTSVIFDSVTVTVALVTSPVSEQ